MKAVFTVVARKDCHLCDDMMAALEAYAPPVQYSVMYLDEHPALESDYGIKVPVLLLDEEEICHYFLDMAALKRRLL